MTDISLSPDGEFIVIPTATSLEAVASNPLLEPELRSVARRDWASRADRNVRLLDVLADVKAIGAGFTPTDPDNANSELVAALLAVSAAGSIRLSTEAPADLPLVDLLSPGNDSWRAEHIEFVMIPNYGSNATTVCSHTVSPIGGRPIVSIVGHRATNGTVILAGVGFAGGPALIEPGMALNPPADPHGTARYRRAITRVHASRVAEGIVGAAEPVVRARTVRTFRGYTVEVAIDVDTGQMDLTRQPAEPIGTAALDDAARAVWFAVSDALSLDNPDLPTETATTDEQFGRTGTAIQVHPDCGLMPEVAWTLLQNR